MTAVVVDAEDRFNKAYPEFKGKIRTFARNAVHSLPLDQEDIEQELSWVLYRCCRDYDPNKGASFNTLFQGSAKRKIIDLIRKSRTQSRTAIIVHLDDEAVRDAIEAMFADTNSAEDIALARLDAIERLTA